MSQISLHHSLRSAVLLLLTLCAVHNSYGMSPEEEFFEQKVRPLLHARCTECHGDKKQQGAIRLDHRVGVFNNADVGPLVVGGKLNESRIWQVVQHSPDDTQMPPDGKLPAEELAIIQKWIETGAVWPAEDAVVATMDSGSPRRADGSYDYEAAIERHWAYRPIENPMVPQPEGSEALENSIDHFILARQEGTGVSLSPEADRRTLLRRLKYDLHGLSPSVDEVQQFEQDTSPQAYENMVDRLLDSPLYGQRWARHWLDIARYADTKGYVFTENRFYPNSYTYRDYVVNALNADKPYNRFLIEQIAADQLGLSENDPNLAAMGFLTVGPRFLNREPDIIDDRIDLVTRGLMGMTAGCARCHDHKYDPVPTQDYYSLYGVFASSTEPEMPPLIGEVDTTTPEYQAFKAELDKREAELQDYCTKTHNALVEDLKRHAADHLIAVLKTQDKLPPGVEATYTHGEPRARSVRRWIDLSAAKLREKNPVFTLLAALVALPHENYQSAAAELIQKAADTPDHNQRVVAALQAANPENVVATVKVFGKVFEDVQTEWDQRLREQRQLRPNEPVSGFEDEASENIRLAILGPGSLTDIPGGERSVLFERDHGNKVRELRSKVQQWLVTADNAPARAMVLVDKPQPVEPVVFVRGDARRRGDRVDRRGPQILAPSPEAKFNNGSGRLELANLIASPDNPLTARVIVNRVWLYFFDQGIVSTPSDFGTRSTTPTHPELLNHLSYRFIHEMNWSLKSLHREILLSQTYRQESNDRSDCRAVDPENLLYWRQNRKRLDFESMRDMTLEAAGHLNTSLGGKPVNLEQQPFSTRRSVYGLIDRNNLPGLLRTFDFPAPDTSNPQRPNTTVPQQALYVLNSEFTKQQADALAALAQAASPDRNQQLHKLVGAVYARNATGEELALFGRFLDTHPQGMSQIAHGLLMSNEFFFID
ncbi:MAG: PSD1 domain-containing protein [Planctomycetaceae bacterium]|nr:PSD1 domain-containing protein [Planctomycetaceae bacterium]MCB9949392.1 PSD1 domain-containing protein [Planctomycetaceae bacterium]